MHGDRRLGGVTVYRTYQRRRASEARRKRTAQSARRKDAGPARCVHGERLDSIGTDEIYHKRRGRSVTGEGGRRAWKTEENWAMNRDGGVTLSP